MSLCMPKFGTVAFLCMYAMPRQVPILALYLNLSTKFKPSLKTGWEGDSMKND